MVESQPSKLLVAGSIPVSRSMPSPSARCARGFGWQATGAPLALAAHAVATAARASVSEQACRRKPRAQRAIEQADLSAEAASEASG